MICVHLLFAPSRTYLREIGTWEVLRTPYQPNDIFAAHELIQQSLGSVLPVGPASTTFFAVEQAPLTQAKQQQLPKPVEDNFDESSSNNDLVDLGAQCGFWRSKRCSQPHDKEPPLSDGLWGHAELFLTDTQ